MPIVSVPYGFCHCGCGEKTPLAKESHPSRMQKRGEPLRYLTGHHLRKSPVPYIVDSETGCWVWQWAKARKYGKVWANGKLVIAHRHYYELAKGPIPEGLVVDHLCKNEACVNPDHLEAVTEAENIRRGDASKLTPETVEEIRKLLTTQSQRKTAKQFGVSHTTVYSIANGGSWTERKDGA